jgi:hypothetical protein
MTDHVASFRRIAALVIIVTLFAVPRAAAQTAPPPQSALFTAALGTAANGQAVWLTTSNGSRLKIRVAAVAPTGLAVTESNGQGHTVPFEDITRIEKVQHRLRKNTTVGAVVGAGLGGWGALFCGQSLGDGCQAQILLTYVGIGAGIGALTGSIKNAVHRADDILYDAGTRTRTTVALTPIFSRSHKGAAFSIAWR